MLNQYLQQVERLARDQKQSWLDTDDMTTFVNIARGQLAGEAECCRSIATLTAVPGQRPYNFSSINVGTPASTGIQGVINVRRLQYQVASGTKWVNNKAWEWFDYFCLNNPVPVAGPPQTWAQFGQGAAGLSITSGGQGTVATGTLYIDPPPDLNYLFYADCSCYPITLASDTDVEAIPYLWTDAVPYFAIYLALMSEPSGRNVDQAMRMKNIYTEFVQRARRFATPSVNPYNYEQVQDPTMQNQLGISGGGAGVA